MIKQSKLGDFEQRNTEIRLLKWNLEKATKITMKQEQDTSEPSIFSNKRTKKKYF